MAVMDDILENKRKEVQEFKEVHGDHVFTGGKPPASFYKAVKKDKTLSVIAEVKRKSPSQGEMAMEEDPADIAKLYAEVGADAISVLTDEKFFGGGFDFLREIADTVRPDAASVDDERSSCEPAMSMSDEYSAASSERPPSMCSRKASRCSGGTAASASTRRRLASAATEAR